MVASTRRSVVHRSASAVLFVLLGCQSPQALARHCREGQLAACEEACRKGVADDGGCVQAGRTYAALRDQAPANLEHAVELFTRGCRDGQVVACVEGAALMDAPRRTELVDRGCALGDAPTCMAVVREAIGVDRDRTTRAIRSWCANVHPGDEACPREREAKIQRTSALSEQCRAAFSACRDLGDALLPLAEPRALRAYSDGCTEHGLADDALWASAPTSALPGAPTGTAACVTQLRADAHDRWGEVLAASIVGRDYAVWNVEPPPFEGAIGRSSPLGPPREPPQLHPRLKILRSSPLPEITPALLDHQPRILGCYERGLAANPHLQGRVEVTGIADRSGVAVITYAHDSDLPDRATVDCVRDALRGLQLPKRDAALRFDVAIAFQPN